MPKLVVANFQSAYHGLVEVRKVKKKFLPRLLSLELQDNAEVPQPFAFGFKVYEEKEQDLSVAVSVVKKDELDEILRENPDVECVVTQEVAFAAICQRRMESEDSAFWCAIVAGSQIRLFLVRRACVIYSTSLPLYSEELSDADVELISSALRYAYNLVEDLPDKMFVGGEDARVLEGKLPMDMERVDVVDPPFDVVKDYNLIPQGYILEKKSRLIQTYVRYGLVVATLLFFLLSLANFYRMLMLSKELSRYDRILEKEYRMYQEIKKMRKQLLKLKKHAEERKKAVTSFFCVEKANNLYNVLLDVGFDEITSVDVHPPSVIFKGKVRAKDGRAEAFLRYITMLKLIEKNGYKVKKNNLGEKGTFSFTVRCAD